MPILTRCSGTLFDPATATEPAAALEAEFAGAWARHEAALVRSTADGQAVAWPAPGAGVDTGSAAADVAAALVYGAVSGVGRGTGLADSCARVLTTSAPRDAQAAAAGQHIVALAGQHYALLTPDARAAVARLAAGLAGGGGGPAPGTAAALGALLRHVRSGLATPENLGLATCVAAALADSLDWLVGGASGAQPAPHAALAQAALLAVARVLPAAAAVAAGGGGGGSAAAAAAASFRKAAAALATPLLTQHWALVAPGGRDLAAALAECGGVPEVSAPLKALGLAGGPPPAGPGGATPTPLALAQAGGPDTPLARAARRRPPSALVASRLAPDAEARLHFLLSSVRLGAQGRYQAWFAARHLAWPGAPPSATTAAVVDAIRFVVAVYRPSAAVLGSDVLPRWALLGWLVSLPRAPGGCAAAAAAAVADWATFDPATDSFMAAEPAALLMLQSLPRYAHVTVTVLDALVAGGGGGGAAAAAGRPPPPLDDATAASLAAGADALVARGVLRDFDRLATAPEVPAGLKARVKAVFARHCGGGGGGGGGHGRAGGGGPSAAAASAPPPPPPPPAPATTSGSASTVADAPGAAAPPAADAAGAKRRRAPSPSPGEDAGDAGEPPAPADPSPAPGPPTTSSAPPPAKVGSKDAGLDAALTALREASAGGGLVAAAAATLDALAPKAAAAPAAKRRRGATPSSDKDAPAPPSPSLVKDAADAVAAMAGDGACDAAWCDAEGGGPTLSSAAPSRASLCGALIAAGVAAGPHALPAAAALIAALRARPATCDAGWRLLAVGVAAEEGEGEWAAAAAAPPAAQGKGGGGRDNDGDDSEDDDDPCVGPAAAAAFRLYAAAVPSEQDTATDLAASLAAAGPAALAASAPPLLRGLAVDWAAAVKKAGPAGFAPSGLPQPVRGVPPLPLRILCAVVGAAGDGRALLVAAADAASGRTSAVTVAGSAKHPAARFQDDAYAAGVVAVASAAAGPSPSKQSAPWPAPAVRALWALVRAETLGPLHGRDTAAAVGLAVLEAAAGGGGGGGGGASPLASSPATLAALTPLLAALQPSAALVKAVLALPATAASAAETVLASWAAPDAGGAAAARAAAGAALEKAGTAVVGGGGGPGRGGGGVPARSKGGGRAGGRKGGGGGATVRAVWGVD